MAINPRSITDEAPYLEASIDELIDLRQRVLDAGHTETVANGVIGFLLAKRAGEATPLTDRTRARYRRILRELGEGDDGDAGRTAKPTKPQPSSPAASARKVGTDGRGYKVVPQQPAAAHDPAIPSEAPAGGPNAQTAHNPQFRYLRLIPGDLGAVEGDEGRKAA